MSDVNKIVVQEIKAFKVFEMAGQSLCLIGSGFFMYEGITSMNLSTLFASFFMSMGQISMIVNSCWYNSRKKSLLEEGEESLLE